MRKESDVSKPNRFRPVRWIALFYGIGFGIVALAIFLIARPAPWGEAKLRFRLWRSGARPLLWEKHRGFVQDRCGGRPTADCVCVWMIHGLGDSVVEWRKVFLSADSFSGIPVRLFALDLPGHGGSLSRRDPREYRVSAMAKEIDDGIGKTVECRRNALIGNGFGGWVATRIALDSPKRYESLLLISPSGTSAADAEAPSGNLPREAEAVRTAQLPADRLDGVLSRVSVPTTIVRSGEDRGFALGIPGAKLVTIPGCGPIPEEECPDRLFPILRDSISAPVASPGRSGGD